MSELGRRSFIALTTVAALGLLEAGCSNSNGGHATANGSSAQPTATRGASSEVIGLALSDSLFGLPEEEIGHRLDRVKSLGATAIRFDWDGLLQSVHGWEPIDRIMRAAAERKLGVMATVTYTPYANQPPQFRGIYTSRPQNIDIFADFAGRATKRYQQYDDDISIWHEVWNEANTSPGGANPAEYAALFSETSSAIRAINKHATVAIGGLAASESSQGNLSPVDFLAAVLNSGLTDYDAVCLHPYARELPDQPNPGSAYTQIEGDPSLPDMPTIYDVLKAHGRPNTEIWLTEMGAPTEGQHAVSIARQAETVSQELTHHFVRANVTQRYIFTLQDWPGHYMYGLEDSQGHPKVQNVNGRSFNPTQAFEAAAAQY